MGLMIRCEWEDPPDSTVSSRFAKVAALLACRESVAIYGSDWFGGRGSPPPDGRGTRTTAESLLKEETWDLDKVPYQGINERFELRRWNGREEPWGGLLIAKLPVVAGQPNWVTLNGPMLHCLRGSHGTVDNVLNLARFAATHLSGRVLVTSTELRTFAEENGRMDDNRIAYAAFWGAEPDRGSNFFECLKGSGRSAPYEHIVTKNWEGPFVDDLGAYQQLDVWMS
jgi:hypothetical protein